MVERFAVRVLIAVALCVALFAFVSVPVPNDPSLPALALKQPGLYRLEIALLVFYGDLLIVTPAFSGLFRGRLPIEISTRGAKFAEETDQSAEAAKAAIKKLEQTAKTLDEGLAAANFEIKRLREPNRDSTQLEVDSES